MTGYQGILWLATDKILDARILILPSDMVKQNIDGYYPLSIKWICWIDGTEEVMDFDDHKYEHTYIIANFNLFMKSGIVNMS